MNMGGGIFAQGYDKRIGADLCMLVVYHLSGSKFLGDQRSPFLENYQLLLHTSLSTPA
jgi:hypothetical protein